MTQFLPPNLLALFAARDPIPYLPPAAKLPHEKKQKGYDGVGAFINLFEHPSETPPPTRVETREERLERRRRERAEQTAYKLEQEIALWDPAANPRATADPFKTLFVARVAEVHLDQIHQTLPCPLPDSLAAKEYFTNLYIRTAFSDAGKLNVVLTAPLNSQNYDTSESKLRREFEGYGAIKKIYMVYNKEDGKPRGYAFIEYEHERDMHSAYKHADGKKIDGKRVLVDVERARTVKGWLPRRLGGGLGGTRRGGADVNIKHSGREDNERERERYSREQRERDEPRGGRRRSRSRSAVRRRSTSRTRRRDRERPERAERPREDEQQPAESRRRRRSRSRSERRRRDKDKERTRDRGDRDRDRKRARRDKDKDKERDRKEPKLRLDEIKVKQEPHTDYPEFSLPAMDVQIKQEPTDDDENKYNPEEANGDDYNY